MAVFCDFDGTITENDNIIQIMRHFNPPGWETIKNAILQERISIQEGVGQLFSLLSSTSKEEITNYAVHQAVIRPGFEEFIQYCQNNDIRLLITSGGIDFFVFPILSRYPIPKQDIYCNASDFSGTQIKIVWPYSCDPECKKNCGMCKPTILRSFSADEYIKIVIGDSITDLKAAELADLVIARDFLLKKSKERSLTYKEFVSFYDVIRILKDLEP